MVPVAFGVMVGIEEGAETAVATVMEVAVRKVASQADPLVPLMSPQTL